MDMDIYLRFLVALAAVLALILILAWIAKRLGYGNATAGKLRPGRRLAIVEVLPVDARRKLVLLRRDDREHLVLLGANHDCVVETAIAAPDAGARPAQPTAGPAEAQR